jgi:curli production assembly/transport component CsgF
MHRAFRAVIVGFGVVASSPLLASSLTYTPTNPTFGGSPLNGSFLLSQAQTQGAGAKSGNSPDLSGLTNALSGLGTSSSVIVANPTSTGN